MPRFEEFLGHDGEAIYINTDHVVAVYQVGDGHDGRKIVHLDTVEGICYMVQGTAREILSRVEHGFKEGPNR